MNTIVSAALGLAALASAANTVQFLNQDDKTRSVIFTAQADLGLELIPDLVIPGYGNASQTFPNGFIGNFYSVNNGSENVPGMLGEVAFNAWDELAFFDVSSIVNDTDHEGVKMLYPSGMNPEDSSTPTSGCNTLGLTKCLNQYNAWDDVATQATKSSSLVCLLGNKNVTDDATKSRRSKSLRRNVELFPRSYVLGAEGSPA